MYARSLAEGPHAVLTPADAPIRRDTPRMRADLPSGTVTFLFTDIEGSTRLLHALGPDAYADALAEHRRLLRRTFAEHRGVEVDTQGDAFFVAFPTAPGAAAAALDGLAALAPGPIRVRMGLHTGAPTVTDEGYVGVDVHRGARVAALAHGGQVVLTEATAALVADVPLRDLGRHRLKDFDGPAHLFQLGSEELPPLRTPGAVDLPTPANRFLGREAELLAAAGLWLERVPRLLTIVGPGGIGKTRFSIELARFLADDADGGTVFVPLAPVRDATVVIPMIAERLGASEGTTQAIGARVGEKPTHVLLDNLEQLLPDVARPLAELLSATPALRLLATSREPVRIAGESELDLPPMGEVDAVRLFLERAQSIRPEIVDAPAVHELARRLDGLPLALELAAARVKLLGPEQVLERIGQRLDLLKGARDADERHATLRATIAWSHDLLDEPERVLFARLAIFRGGCTLEDAEAVCGADLDTLASLLDKSLVRRRVDPDGVERFWMLEMIREFARERLDESGEESHLRRAQADRLIVLADRAGTRAIVDAPRAWDFDLVAPELDNVRAVLDWALEHDPGRGLRLATWLEAFWVVRDPFEGASWLERLIARAPDAEPALRAAAFRSLGGALDIVGDSERAAPWYAQSLALFTSCGDAIQAAHLRFRVGANAYNRGEPGTAWPLIEGALEESRRLGVRVGECQALGVLGLRARDEGDPAGAVELMLESAMIAGEVRWEWWEAHELANAADLERELGQVDAAEKHALRSAELCLGLGDRQGTVFATAELAMIATVRGDPERAGRLWGALESEVSAGRVGQWESFRTDIEAQVLAVDGPTFSRARDEGRLLSIAEAVGLESAQTVP